MEQKIIDFLISEYQPEAVLLGGSRMKGTETEKSDWDFFLVGAKNVRNEFVQFEGQRLDVTCKEWPEKNKALTIPTGPLWPIKVILDNSHGRLENVLSATKDMFNAGPFNLHKNAVLTRLQKLDSWNRKIEKYHTDPMVEFVYAGIFYEVSIRVWFEIRDMWPKAPVEALPIIKEKDIDFYNSLSAFVASSSNERSRHSEYILKALKDTQGDSV
jgi:hypothetical protein